MQNTVPLTKHFLNKFWKVLPAASGLEVLQVCATQMDEMEEMFTS